MHVYGSTPYQPLPVNYQAAKQAPSFGMAVDLTIMDRAYAANFFEGFIEDLRRVNQDGFSLEPDSLTEWTNAGSDQVNALTILVDALELQSQYDKHPKDFSGDWQTTIHVIKAETQRMLDTIQRGVDQQQASVWLGAISTVHSKRYGGTDKGGGGNAEKNLSKNVSRDLVTRLGLKMLRLPAALRGE